MDSNRIVKVKRLDKPIEKSKPPAQLVQQLDPNIEPVSEPEIEQPEQPEPVVHLKSLAEPTREESVYGSGWSVAQLMNEFSGRYK